MLRSTNRRIFLFSGTVIVLLVAILSWFLFRLKPTEHTPVTGKEPLQTSKALESLGYLTWAPLDDRDKGKSGVTVHDPDRAYPGINLFFSENMAGAYLLNMSGDIIHRLTDRRKEQSPWKLIKPYLDNYFLVLTKEQTLMVVDWDSRIKGIRKGTFHHDLAAADNGDIYTLTNQKGLFPAYGSSEPIVDNQLLIMAGNGSIKKELSFASLIAENSSLLDAARNQDRKFYCYGRDAWDVFHGNTLEIIDREIILQDGVRSGKGDVLFCMRHLDAIGVLSMARGKIIWSWGPGELEHPHHPSMLTNGNILIFDNGVRRRHSRVIELDPSKGEIVWEYHADPPQSFFSPTRGSAQRLPNGNTLITESDRGRVFEVTGEGETVWEFFSPEIHQQRQQRATLYRMTRIVEPGKQSRLAILLREQGPTS